MTKRNEAHEQAFADWRDAQAVVLRWAIFNHRNMTTDPLPKFVEVELTRAEAAYRASAGGASANN